MEEIVELYKGQISSHEAGTLLESVPALGTNFSYSTNDSTSLSKSKAPRPSPNPSPF